MSAQHRVEQDGQLCSFLPTFRKYLKIAGRRAMLLPAHNTRGLSPAHRNHRGVHFH